MLQVEGCYSNMRMRLIYLEVGNCNLEDFSIELCTLNAMWLKRINPVIRSQILKAASSFSRIHF